MRTKFLLILSLSSAVFHAAFCEEVPATLLVRLASDNFSDRQKSQKELLAWARDHGEQGADALVKLLVDDDPEIRKRSYEILRRLSDEDYLSDGQGYLGIMMGEEMIEAGLNGKPGAGIRISRVIKGSPADFSGLMAGDLIIALDGAAWQKQGAMDVFMRTIAEKKPLADVILTIRRNAAELIEIKVKLGKRPIADLSLAREDPQVLDMQAKDEHFKAWLKRLPGDR